MNKDTKIIISIAERPGNLGVEFHNQGYVHLGLNFVYLPLKVLPTDLEGTISLIRNNFRGCSVSMPHKEKIARYLDELDKTAREVGAVNTTLNESGKLIGYNTDVLGARTAIESRLDVSGKKVLMLGAGGAARAVGYAVKQLGGRLAIANRTEPKARELADKLGLI
jgi:shikimate dehydrogenase